MQYYVNETIMECSHCKKELDMYGSYFASKFYNGLCSDCRYFECMGVYTIQDYNEWLRKHLG